MNNDARVIHVQRERAGRTTNVLFRRGPEGPCVCISAHVLRELGGSQQNGIHRVINAFVAMKDDEVNTDVAKGNLTKSIIERAHRDQSPSIALSTLLS